MARQFATIEEFRSFLIQENQKAQGPLWRFMSQDERNSTLAAGKCWNDSDPVTNAFLEKYMNYFNQLAQRRENAKDSTPTAVDVCALLRRLLGESATG